MDKIRLEPECIACLVTKQINNYPENASAKQKLEYMRKLLRLAADAPETMSAPQVMDKITRLQTEMFGAPADYSAVKRHFNGVMLKRAEQLKKVISSSDDPLRSAVQLAMTGNYIDFAAMVNVNEKKLDELLESAHGIEIPENELDMLRSSLGAAKRLVYLTDNCGEIVLDKLLISVIKEIYPGIDITAVVRGYPVINDATMEDAEDTGLCDMVRVIDNGSGVAGTCLDSISEQAREEIDSADVIIAKGQGNFETLRGCGLNIFYVFMCKCSMFAKRFNAPVLTGILVNDSEV